MANERKPGAPVAVTAGAAAPITLMLDRSRAFSEVHGDTEHNVGYFQDGLPFDKVGRVIQRILTPEQKTLVQRKVTRIKEAMEEAERTPVDDTSNSEPDIKQIDDDPDADVNLSLWAQGKVKYLPHIVYRVARKRYSKRFNTLDEVRDYLVQEKVIEAGSVVR